MSKILPRAAALFLAVLVTVATFAGADRLAQHQFVRADEIAMQQYACVQSVVVTAHRAHA